MLGWSIKLFRVRGIQLALHWSFFLLLFYVAFRGNQPDPDHDLPGGWIGATWNISLVLAFFTCVVLHELGHSFTAMRFGVGVRRILLMPIGGMAEFDSIPRQPKREFLITIAGPMVNFTIAFLLWLSVRKLPDDLPLYSIGTFAKELLIANLVMGCFNLLPVFPMDGGRMLRAILASRSSYVNATRWASRVGKVMSITGCIAALLLSFFHIAELWMLAILFAFIFFAGEVEYRAVLRREREDAHWRAMLARFYPNPGPLQDPPVLSP